MMAMARGSVLTRLIERSMAALLLGLLGLNSAWGAGRPASGDQSSEAASEWRQANLPFVAVAKQATPAVVFIRVTKRLGGDDSGWDFNPPSDPFREELLRRFFGQGDPRRSFPEFVQRGQGTGFLVSKDGYILTNHHIVGDADEIMVKLHDGREFKATRIGSDPKSEVAVIKIEGDDFPYLEMGRSENLEVGEWVMAVGNPFGLDATVTVGVVSAKGRSGMGIADYEDFIQTDAAINPGNSGGPLLNIDGQVIGINTAIFSRNGGYMGIGFAIPIDMADLIREQLIHSGRVTRGYLGVFIQDLENDLARSFGLKEPKGILIAGVEAGSPADQAGLRQDDVILEMNGTPVSTGNAFRGAVSANPPGTVLALTIQRDGAIQTLSVVTGTLPGEKPPDVLPVPDDRSEGLGLSVKDLTEEDTRRFDYADGSGILIVAVAPESVAARQGLQPGSLITSVNRKAVTRVEEYEKALSGIKDGDFILLHVRSGPASRYVVLRRDEARSHDRER